MDIRKTLTIAVAVAALARVSWAQEASPQNPPAPAGDAPAVTDEPQLTKAQLIEYYKTARPKRLTMEREQVAAELREGLLFDPDKVEPAIKAMNEGAKNHWGDNAERVCKAFAAVDGRFGKAYELLKAGDFEKAAGAIKPLISERDTSYFTAAKRYCYAQALAGLKKNDDAVECFTDLVKVMPDRFSFSAQALMDAAKTYETMGRMFYAATLYKLWVDSFGLMDAELADALAKKADQIEADYKDPLGTLATKMTDVQKRLAEIDSGRDTQKRQREIVAMLDDLIKNIQDQQTPPSSSSSNASGKKPGDGKGEGEGEGEGEGKGKGKGKQGPPSGIGQPSSPATVSKLVGGEVLRPTEVSAVRPSDPTDDWGKLSPVERQKMLEAFKENMPERYRDQLSEYYKKMAAGQGK